MERDEERRKYERRREERGREINRQDYVIGFFVNGGRERVKDGNGLGGLSNIDFRGAFSRMCNLLQWPSHHKLCFRPGTSHWNSSSTAVLY